MLPILARSLGLLLDAGLKCKPRKCQAFPDSIHYLGHIIKDGKIAADRSKLDRIREWPYPKTVNVIDSFLGMSNYYRRLRQYFTDYAVIPYKELLELNVTAAVVLKMAFTTLKDEICDDVAVKLPNPDNPFVVETHASLHAFGTALLQREWEAEYPTLFF